jgi:hypothetical protein
MAAVGFQTLTDSFSLSPLALLGRCKEDVKEEFPFIFARFRLLSSVMALTVLLSAWP